MSSAACGGDLLFIQEVFKRGGTVRVTLPFSRKAFARTSVGPDWKACYESALAHPNVSVAEMSDEDAVSTQEPVAYQRCNDALQADAIHCARLLEKTPIMLALWDGKPGDGMGGSAFAIQEWRQKGYEVEVIHI